MSNVDRALRILRSRRGLSQRELAKAAGLTSLTIARIESGRSSATDRTLQMVAGVLDTTVEGILQLAIDLSKPEA